VLGVVLPAFYTVTNLDNVGQLIATLGAVAVGQLVVMLAGGIDLSVGATTSITLVAIASISHGSNGKLPLAIAACVGIGIAIGLVNAGLVVVRRVPPFVATLGTMILIEGVVTAWTGGALQGDVPPALRKVSTVNVGPVSLALAIFVVLAVAVAWLLLRSSFGRRLYAVGMNERASAYAGIRVGAVRAATYVLSALAAVVAGLLLAGYVGYVDQYAGQDLHLQSIAAAVVGGVSLLGGRGTVRGAVFGAALMTIVLDVGLLEGLSGQTQSLLTGAVLLVAAFVYGARRATA
jgi:ribose/xylose/arabinose/galactoside ABC-type transport system permease subunit